MYTVVDEKTGRIIMVCLFGSVYDNILISYTEYISWNDRTKVHNKKGRTWMEDIAD
jgi:hypothetical protein